MFSKTLAGGCIALLAGLASCQNTAETVTITTTVSGSSETVWACTPAADSPTSTSADVPTATANGPVGGQTVDQTILIFARDEAGARNAYFGLEGYGIPYEVNLVPQEGTELPALASSSNSGNYGGIMIMSEVGYDYDGTWRSALTDDQMETLYNYQTSFGVRMVRIDVYPQPAYGTETAIASTGCCDSGVEQMVSFTNDTGFATANLKMDAGVTQVDMWHYPARITYPQNTWEIAKFAPDANGQFSDDTVAAVINEWDGRQQMVWFTSWAVEWSVTSNYLQHAHIHWMTRGLFLGARKVYLNAQVDDMHLNTDLYLPQGATFRLRPEDMDAHLSWQQDLNRRMPEGSRFFLDIAHNGNGDIIYSTINDTSGLCDPENAIYYPGREDPPLEFQKPLGTGNDQWPVTPTEYTWTIACARIDDLATWFMDSNNRDAFGHLSHTFTHLNLNNVTYSDADKEIFFNQAWERQVGIADAPEFSANGLVPPAITGLHNGDAIRAFIENGITNVVGDNSRSNLVNQQFRYWPYISTVENNGYEGLNIMPRWPTAIYYNCDLPECTTQEWIDTSGGSGDFQNLLAYERRTTARYLFQLRHDPYMFHQANLRQADVESLTIGDQSGQMSLIQAWSETVVQEMTRLTNWPLITLKHDDIAQEFLNRMARDNCNPELSYRYSDDGRSITGVTVTADGNSCSAPIPVTFPGQASTGGDSRTDQVGSEPPIQWVSLNGSPVSFSLATPVAAN
ncbi:hypothetical protein MBLNU230_g2801t1 [Neophaeotheca triangularis]